MPRARAQENGMHRFQDQGENTRGKGKPKKKKQRKVKLKRAHKRRLKAENKEEDSKTLAVDAAPPTNKAKTQGRAHKEGKEAGSKEGDN